MGVLGVRRKTTKKLQEPNLIIDEDELIRNIQSDIEYKGNAPLDVWAIAKLYGIDVCLDETLDSQISGYLKKDANEWKIGINAKHAKTRQRFTLAHELAHYFLHRDTTQMQLSFVDELFFRDSSSSDYIETIANRFAAKLLMPETVVKHLIDRGVRKVSEMAAHFGVSIMAMSYRLVELGYRVK